jgi:hypothetical protein
VKSPPVQMSTISEMLPNTGNGTTESKVESIAPPNSPF